MTRGSLRFRLTVMGAAAVCAALLVSTLAIGFLFSRHAQRMVLSELDARFEQLVAGLENEGGTLRLIEPPADPRFSRPYSGHYWEVLLNGENIRSRSLWDYVLPLPAPAAPGPRQEIEVAGPQGEPLLVRYQVIAVPGAKGPTNVRVAVAQSTEELDRIRDGFLADLIPYTAIVALVLIGAGSLQLAFGLRPLAEVGRRVAALNAGALSRLGTDVPGEVRPLAREIDNLLDARDASVERARLRAGDLAHGMKTPLQALMGEAGRLRQAGRTEAAQSIEEIAGSMRRHVDHELARARIASGGTRPAGLSAAPLAVAQTVLAVLRRVPGHADIEFLATGDAACRAMIDMADLTELVGALAENAARHARTRVTIAVIRAEDLVRLEIRDDGPGIHEPMMDAIRNRGVRADTNAQGQGFGLAIATEIAEAAGGALHLENARPGLSVVVLLPAVG